MVLFLLTDRDVDERGAFSIFLLCLFKRWLKEMVRVNKTTIENIGERKEISDEALERFVEVYLKMIKKNEIKIKRLLEGVPPTI
ncbi:hypothetical protein BFRIPC_00106 (plasmid) [Peribacillus frigoritolerans]